MTRVVFVALLATVSVAPCAGFRAPALSPRGGVRHAAVSRVVSSSRGGSRHISFSDAPPPPLKAPPALTDGVIAAGAAKASMPASKIVMLGIISGAHIAFGACLCMMVGGAVPAIKAANPGLQRIIYGAFGLPFGLLMTVITGAELFTGNTAFVTMALMNGKTTLSNLTKSWFCSYLGNLIGSLIIAYLFFLSGVMHAGAATIATAKVSMPWIQAFARGILCNWLVCMAVWMASGASDLASKAVAIWFPISAFVALGLEHCVANMCIIPLGMMLAAPISISTFITNNLIPVTLGNTVGGGLFVALFYHLAYKKLPQSTPSK